MLSIASLSLFPCLLTVRGCVNDATTRPVSSVHCVTVVLSLHLSSVSHSVPSSPLATSCTRLPLVLVPLDPTMMGLNSVRRKFSKLRFMALYFLLYRGSKLSSRACNSSVLLLPLPPFLAACQSQITELLSYTAETRVFRPEPEGHRVTSFGLCPALHPLLSQWKKCPLLHTACPSLLPFYDLGLFLPTLPGLLLLIISSTLSVSSYTLVLILNSYRCA